MQTEMLKGVRETLAAAQSKAAATFASLDGDARKLFEQLVERGRSQQQEIGERLVKLADGNAVFRQVKPGVEDAFRHLTHAEYRALAEQLSKTVRELQGRAIGAFDAASREQAKGLSVELRKLADRLEALARKAEIAEAAGVTSTVPTVETGAAAIPTPVANA